MGTVNRYYTPTKRMQEAAIGALGFSPLVETPGGYLSTREHVDCRFQALWVFPWSNYLIAERDGIPPCNLCIRVTLDMPRMEQSRVQRHAPAGVHTTVWFDRELWHEVAPTLVRLWLPALDAPLEDGRTLLQELAEATVHVPGLQMAGVRA